MAEGKKSTAKDAAVGCLGIIAMFAILMAWLWPDNESPDEPQEAKESSEASSPTPQEKAEFHRRRLMGSAWRACMNFVKGHYGDVSGRDVLFPGGSWELIEPLDEPGHYRCVSAVQKYGGDVVRDGKFRLNMRHVDGEEWFVWGFEELEPLSPDRGGTD